MSTKAHYKPEPSPTRRAQVSPNNHKGNGYYDIPLGESTRTSYRDRNSYLQRTSLIEQLELIEPTKALATYNYGQYQLIPVEIEKEAQLGLVVGQIEGESWVFIDEILPHGMIDTHGVLKEGDYLIQAGNYSLVDIDVSKALLFIERAYDDGRKTISFVAARQEKSDVKSSQNHKPKKVSPEVPKQDIKEMRARSFVEYENEEEEAPPPPQVKPGHSKKRKDVTDTKF
ncbi:unnamed protein product [Rotaria socialis]|uniref:PDZ domain-containing protein n=1 Tax=Rotaria socialis TaxID=392032 RepID=A0A821G2Y1_9BILA|nr:unnamed protein product [Rotaria socialis]CAF4660747.1 unnamed protein product [Rotaria socialis]